MQSVPPSSRLKNRPIQIVGNILVLTCLISFGYFVAPDDTYEAANWFIFVAFILHLILVCEKLFHKQRLQQAAWAYIRDNYTQYPTDLWSASVPKPEHPINFDLAGPLIMRDNYGVRLNDIYEIPVAQKKHAYLTRVDVSRNIFGRINQQLADYELSYIVMAINLDLPTPHIFIDGRSQNHFRRKSTDLWSLTKRLSKREKIQDLEGDFYKYFDVYAADREYLSALTIVTPDVMLALKEQGYSFDYEIYDGKLYVIHETNVSSKEEMQALITAAQTCLGELIPQLTKHSYTDTDKTLTIHSVRMNLWALNYSGLIVGKYLLKVIALLVVGVVVGGLIQGLTS